MADSYDHGHVHPQHGTSSYQGYASEPARSGYEADPADALAEPGRIGRMLSVLGAVGSLVLVVGIGIWGYKLVMRDVSGVPVVRALDGPMRIQPDSPGGQPADHQGLAVNTVAAAGTAAPPADRLVLAPRPVSLIDEDKPATAPQPQVEAAEEVASAETAPATPDPAVSDEAVLAFRQGSVDALVAELTETAQPRFENAVLTGAVPKPEPAAIVQPEPLPAIDPADLMAAIPDPELLAAPGVKRSLRPQTRPARAVPVAVKPKADLADAINAAVETAAGLDVDPAKIPQGTRLAQLGAFDSPDIARAEWDRLTAQFGDYLGDKQRVIQKASSGGRTFYRLRAMGFADLSDTRRFCAALVAEKADCIPVAAR